MALGEMMSEKLKLIDSKKTSLHDVILRLAMEWKDLDELLDSTEECVQGTLDELFIRENNLDLVRESLRQSNKELELMRESVESRAQELEMREKGFLSFQQTQIEELKLKQKQLDTLQRSANERIKEAELRINEQHESFEGLSKKLETEKEQVEHIQKSIGQRFEEIMLKETYFEGRSRELDSIQNWIERRAKELDAKEEQVDDRVNELALEEELMRKLNEEHCKELELKQREIFSAQKLNEERSEKLDSKENQLDAVQKYINQSFKEFHSQRKQLVLDQKLCEERRTELELKEKQLEERCKEVELKQKQFVNSSVHSRVKAEQVEDMIPADKAEIQFVVTMDGRSLQLFLNERSLDDESMASEVYRALRLSLDPAKLVLDAMEGFYPPHLKKGDVEFEEDVVRKSCIVLLEQLMKISPQIKPCVKEGALKLAEEWKAKMRAVSSNYLEVLGFLQLLASYNLASGFDTDELFKLFAVVAEHNQATDLCRVLGFIEKIPDLIENFVKGNQELVAVRLSFGFGLCDKFPPEPLLKRYLKRSKKVFRKQRYMIKESREEQDWVIDERVASIRAAIKCIVDHNLESQFSYKGLEQDIKQLLIQKESDQRIRARLIKVRAPAYNANKVTFSASAPVHPKASASKLYPTTHTMACIFANMDGKNLQLFLNEHLEEHEWMHKDIYDALQMSSDSGQLVLDAIQGFYPPHSKKGAIDIEAGVIRRSCIFLLEILVRLSPQIKPQVKGAAMKLAVYWKTKAAVETANSVAVLGFLLLVGAYGLAPTFTADELRNLFQTVAENRLAPQLSLALGFSEKVPVNSLLHDQSVSENLQLNSIVPSSSLGPSCSMQGAVPPCVQFASDPAKLVLDSMLGCYNSNFKANAINAFNLLLSQLLGVPLEVKTAVKEEAMKFASDWKDKVKQRSPSEVWCFLLFLATYKGASCFPVNELLGLLEIVSNRRQSTDLFRALGLADKASNFIRRLIKRKLYLEAIRYIYGFSLVDEFPPTPLLQRYLIHEKEWAKHVCKDKAIRKELAALRAVIKCIELHGLESQYSPEALKTRIEELLTQQRSVAPAPAAKGRPPKEMDKSSARQSVAVLAQPQELLTQQRSVAPAPAAKGRPPKEVDKSSARQSVAVLAQPQEQDRRKRFDSSTPPQQQAAKKIRLDHVSTAHPIQSLQQPHHHPPGVSAAETAPYLTTTYTHYSLGASTHLPAMHMSHIQVGYGSGTPASGGFPPFGSVGTAFGSAPNFNAKPYTVAETPHYSLSVPHQAGLSDFKR
ncbi:hypothetical protein Vadar_001624 [Vaccinium darrowii]|uniref:Uncharacterized protein n=1 Tax=Vaccinium darrowii TaxID=229202 RepID=A0ACB7XXG8_9ERIC|nr:hypothetical protein Vadar_001624 [Vaccinium darrowii]